MKRKVWDITVKDNPNRVVMGENDEFYTTDTEAFLIFNLQDEDFHPQSAMITLENRNDGSLKSEEVEVIDGDIQWEMPERYIEHSGNWQAQLVYEQMKGSVPEKYTSGVMTFTVNSHIKDKKKPSLVEIENWEKFIREGTELIETWEDLEALREENERQRQANYQELLDTGVLQTNINTKLEQLEEEYAPRLTEVTAQLAQTAKQIGQRTEISIHDFEHLVEGVNELNNLSEGDWSTALEAAFDYLTESKTGGIIRFRDMNYFFSRPINIYKDKHYDEIGEPSSEFNYARTHTNITIVGDGMDNTFLSATSDNNLGLFKPHARVNEDKWYFTLTFKDLRLIGNDRKGLPFIFSDTTMPIYLYFTNVSFLKFEYGYYYHRNLGYGHTNFTNCHFFENDVGVHVGGDNTIFVNCFIYRNKKEGIIFSEGAAFNFFGGKIQYNSTETASGSQIVIRNAKNINFYGTYFEPSSTTPPFDLNEGKTFIDFRGTSVSNVTLKGCYLMAHKLMYIGGIGAGVNVKRLTIEDCYFSSFKLELGGSLFSVNTAKGGSLTGVKIGPTNTFIDFMDQNEEPTDNWRLSNKEEVQSVNSVLTLENRLKGGQLVDITGAVDITGRDNNWFGKSYTVLKEGLGTYKVTLKETNIGTESGSETYFPVVITPINTSIIIPTTKRVDGKEFIVYTRGIDGELIDSGFSFSAKIVIKS